MRVGIDLDGVIRNMVGALIPQYNFVYGDGVHLHNDVKQWDLSKSFPQFKNEHYYKWGEKLFLNANPYVGALRFMDDLNKTDNDIYIVTNQPKGLEDLTINWLKKFEIEYKGVIFSSDKDVFNGDILFDDSNYNLERFSGLSVCMDRPWNQDYKSIKVRCYEDFLILLKNEKD